MRGRIREARARVGEAVRNSDALVLPSEFEVHVFQNPRGRWTYVYREVLSPPDRARARELLDHTLAVGRAVAGDGIGIEGALDPEGHVEVRLTSEDARPVDVLRSLTVELALQLAERGGSREVGRAWGLVSEIRSHEHERTSGALRGHPRELEARYAKLPRPRPTWLKRVELWTEGHPRGRRGRARPARSSAAT